MSRSIKTILVSLNNPACFESSMGLAAKIAKKYDSQIIGLYVIPSAIVYTSPYGYGGPINCTDLNRHYRAKASGVEDAFNDYRQKEGLNAEWRQISSSGHFVSDTIIEHAREADLLIIGDDNSGNFDAEFEGRIIQALGRPVLLVPKTTPKDHVLNKAMIAWDGSKEAARASFDAIPLLQMSDETEVTCFNSQKEREISGDVPGAELASALSRYDINVTSVSEKTRKSIGEAIIEKAKTSDLLVMGAYGHSRLREEIFGGATHKALAELPCPILMSN